MTLSAPLGKKDPEAPPSEKKKVIAVAIIFILVIIGVYALTSQGGGGNSPHATNSQPVKQPNTQSAPNSPIKPVDFVIRAGSQDKCGLTCRQLTPSITNTGTDTAHNVCISIALYNSGGDLIALNGGPSVRKCIGDIASGETMSEPIVIDADCGFLASKCIRQTLILKTVATCDETTIQFPDRIIAV